MFKFFIGQVLILSTGYYSNRLFEICKNAKQKFNIIKNDFIDWKDMNKIKGKYDWIWCCYVETSIGLKLPIFDKKLSKKLGANWLLMRQPL